MRWSGGGCFLGSRTSLACPGWPCDEARAPSVRSRCRVVLELLGKLRSDQNAGWQASQTRGQPNNKALMPDTSRHHYSSCGGLKWSHASHIHWDPKEELCAGGNHHDSRARKADICDRSDRHWTAARGIRVCPRQPKSSHRAFAVSNRASSARRSAGSPNSILSLSSLMPDTTLNHASKRSRVGSSGSPAAGAAG